MKTSIEQDQLNIIEETELRVGSNFHAFRFGTMEPNVGDELALVEEEELRVGSNFHAFRFGTMNPLDGGASED